MDDGRPAARSLFPNFDAGRDGLAGGDGGDVLGIDLGFEPDLAVIDDAHELHAGSDRGALDDGFFFDVAGISAAKQDGARWRVGGGDGVDLLLGDIPEAQLVFRGFDEAGGLLLDFLGCGISEGAAGLAWAEGSLWVGQYRARKIHQVDPETGKVLRTIDSNRFVTGVTWVDGELWHGLAPSVPLSFSQFG